MTPKTLVIIDHIIDLMNSCYWYDEHEDEYGRSESYNEGVKSCIYEVEKFKKFLTNMGVKE